MRKLGFKLSIIEAGLNLLDAYKKKGVFQPKVRSPLLFIREFYKHNHTQLFCWIIECWGWVICRTLILHILGKKSSSKWRWNLKKNDTRLTADFTWPAIFAVSRKTQLYGYFYIKDKNPAILLTLLVLALLIRKLSTMRGVVIQKSTITNYSTPLSPD